MKARQSTLLAGLALLLAAPAAALETSATPQAMAVSNTQQASAQTVCRSMAEMRRAAGDEYAAVAKILRPETIDFSKKMVVVIRAGRVNAFGVSVRVTKFVRAKDGKTATVHWLYKPYFGGAAPPNQPGNPTLVAVLDRFDGPVKFQRKNWQYPKGLPLPPSAPPSRPPVPRK
jgi:hypothetical protein